MTTKSTQKNSASTVKTSSNRETKKNLPSFNGLSLENESFQELADFHQKPTFGDTKPEDSTTKSSTKKSSFDKEIPETQNENQSKAVFNADYSPEEELFLGQAYSTTPLDYVQMFYGYFKSNVQANPYANEDTNPASVNSDVENKLISDRQAEQAAIKIQYSAALGSFECVSFRERENYSNWVKFNPVLMRLFESVHGLTSDVNYDKLF